MSRYSLWVLCILLGALAIRYNGGQLSVYNDETGSYSRTQVGSLDALMNDKIKKSVHPGGFFLAYYYWQKLVGGGVLAHKSLSVLFNMIALLLAFGITRLVFGRWQALLVLVLLGTLEFNAYHAQNIRPYAMGQMTVLWAVWHLEHLRLRRGRLWLHLVGMCLALALSAYAHYFAALSAALVFGLFTLRMPRPLRWWIMGVAAVPVLLFSPHLAITISHLKRGGLSWLPPPDLHFVTNYYTHLTHHSWWLGLGVAALLIWGWLAKPKGWQTIQKSLPYSLSFLGVFVIGILYSHWRAPVLQYSSLYFTAPLLIIGCFGAVPIERWRWRKATIFVLVLLCVGSLYFERNYHKVMARSGNTGWVKATQAALDTHPTVKTLILCSSNNANGLELAMRDQGADFDYTVQTIKHLDRIPKLLPHLDTSRYDRVILNLAAYEIPEYPAIVHSRFPEIEYMELGVQYAHYVFRRPANWQPPQLHQRIAPETAFTHYQDYVVPSDYHYPVFKARFKRHSTETASVVLSSHTASGEQRIWRGAPFRLFDGGDTTQQHSAMVGFPDLDPQVAFFKGGIWNPDRAAFAVWETGFSLWPHNFYWPGLNQAVHGQKPYPWRPLDELAD